MKKSIFIIAFSFISLSLFAGGGWTQKKGTGFYQLSQWYVISDEHFTGNGEIDPNLTSGLFNTNLYAEYGVSDNLTGILFFPLFSRAYTNNLVSGTTGDILQKGEAINGLGDPTIGLKYAIIKNKPVVLSGRIDLGIPLGITNGGSLGSLQTGDGEFNQSIRLDVSTSKKFNKINTYYSLYSGINNREKAFSDEFLYGAELGAIFYDKVILTVKAIGVKSLQNGVSTGIENSASIFASNTEYMNFSPGISYLFNERVGVSAEFSKPITGKIVFSDPSYSLSIFLKL